MDNTWRKYAACIGVPELFLPGDTPMLKADKDLAKQFCNSCPVKEPCLIYAFEVDAPFGVWGGMTQRERRANKELKAKAMRRELAGGIKVEWSNLPSPEGPRIDTGSWATVT